jgi:hypothetical protein
MISIGAKGSLANRAAIFAPMLKGPNFQNQFPKACFNYSCKQVLPFACLEVSPIFSYDASLSWRHQTPVLLPETEP